MRVGILTFHRSVNYGAYLQAMALCNRLNEEEEIDAEIIDYRMKCDARHYKYNLQTKRPERILYKLKLNHTFKKSVSDLPKSSRQLVSDSPESFCKFVYGKYDVIVAGSDEIWRTDTFRGFPNPYWLPGDLGCKKVAYAVSAARCCFADMVDEDKVKLKTLLEGFEYIGIRDQKTFSELEKLDMVNQRLYLCCDPSLIYSFDSNPDNGRKIMYERYHMDSNKKTVLYMGGNGQVLEIIKHRFPDINILSVYILNKGVVNAPDLMPLEWLDIIAAADFFVTEYFHGTCFSLVNSTPFFAVETRASNNETSKLYNLLRGYNLLDRYDLNYSDTGIGRMMEYMSEALKGGKVDYSAIVGRERDNFKGFVRVLKGLENDEG